MDKLLAIALVFALTACTPPCCVDKEGKAAPAAEASAESQAQKAIDSAKDAATEAKAAVEHAAH